MVVSACFPVIALMRLFNQERPIITTLGNWLLLAFLLLLLWCINRHSIIKSELDLGAANIKWTNDSRMKLRKTKPITHWGCESLLSSLITQQKQLFFHNDGKPIWTGTTRLQLLLCVLWSLSYHEAWRLKCAATSFFRIISVPEVVLVGISELRKLGQQRWCAVFTAADKYGTRKLNQHSQRVWSPVALGNGFGFIYLADAF